MQNNYDIIRSLLRTEKGADLLPDRKYFFRVRKDSNKMAIKKAVEEIYKVKVSHVNTSVSVGKRKRVRYIEGMTSEWKKAIVTLKEGNKIETT